MLQNNKKYGPYSEEQMRSFIGEGRLKGDALVWCKGMKGWARIADVEPFRSHFARPEAVAGPPPPIPSEGRGVGRKAVAGALVIVVIVSLLGVWWIYFKPTQTTQPQSGQPTQTGPAFGEAEGTLYTTKEEGVHDGDTIYVSVPLTLANPEIENEISDLMWGSYFSVRFAMVAAPELGENGSYEARSLVKELITNGGTKVYLDLDNEAMGDGKQFHDTTGNRLQAVVYVYIDNKLINVNAEVVRLGQDNFNADWKGRIGTVQSEFDPNEWLENDYPYIQ